MQSESREIGTKVFQPQQKIALSEKIYSTIREAILDGTLMPGERLVESKVSEQMGVSRASMREAIRKLQNDGLVEITAHRETRVVSLTLDDFKELHLIRCVLETLFYQLIADKLTEEDLETIETVVVKMEEAAEMGDSRKSAHYDFKFHEELALFSDLPRLYSIWREQHVLFRLWLNYVAGAEDHDLMKTAADQRMLFNAIKSRDRKIIGKQVFLHIYYSGGASREERASWGEEIAWFFDQFK